MGGYTGHAGQQESCFKWVIACSQLILAHIPVAGRLMEENDLEKRSLSLLQLSVSLSSDLRDVPCESWAKSEESDDICSAAMLLEAAIQRLVDLVNTAGKDHLASMVQKAVPDLKGSGVQQRLQEVFMKPTPVLKGVIRNLAALCELDHVESVDCGAGAENADIGKLVLAVPLFSKATSLEGDLQSLGPELIQEKCTAFGKKLKGRISDVIQDLDKDVKHMQNLNDKYKSLGFSRVQTSSKLRTVKHCAQTWQMESCLWIFQNGEEVDADSNMILELRKGLLERRGNLQKLHAQCGGCASLEDSAGALKRLLSEMQDPAIPRDIRSRSRSDLMKMK